MWNSPFCGSHVHRGCHFQIPKPPVLKASMSCRHHLYAICSMCKTSCAHMILCAPFAPKAVIGLKQTSAFTRLRRYITLKNDTTYVNDSEAFHEAHELPRVAKPKKPRANWFSTRGTGNDTTYSVESERTPPLNAM
ncbi:hypothetical protein M434DRAFT_34370 [Hypoxylon sp. CO27-5]|nr:hypothetical protein M434DRAFT_34370 [Hypoxylon sp. CO27-5]